MAHHCFLGNGLMAPELETQVWFGACGKQWDDPISLPLVGVALGLNQIYQGHIATGCVLLKHPAHKVLHRLLRLLGLLKS